MNYPATSSVDLITLSPFLFQENSEIQVRQKYSTISESAEEDDYFFIAGRSIDITRNARENARSIEDKSLAQETEITLAVIRKCVEANSSDHNFPSIHLFKPEDGSILIEWIFQNLRLGINIEQNKEESSWFFVTNENLGNINAYGHLESTIRKPVLKWLISFIISNPSLVN
jgi:hypothetical protein